VSARLHPPIPWRIWAAAAAAIVVASVLPFIVENYWLRVWTTVLMFVAVAQGLNIIVGFAGYHSFGNAAFFGVGAYVTGVLMAKDMPFLATLPLAAGVSAAIALVVGYPLLRLRGHYFAIATVALNMAFAELIITIGGATGGAQGLPLPMTDMPPNTLYRVIYFLMLASAVIATALVAWLTRSRFGFALRALKDSDSGAQAMGINTTRTRVLAWMMSAAVTGLVGGIWAYWLTFIEVGSAFDIGISVKGYIMMLIGGMGTVIGPVLGAIFFELFATLIWSRFGAIHNLVLGVLVCAVVLLIPQGLLALVRARRRRKGTAP
jgi:branched-chain amino acid transport system permease protein